MHFRILKATGFDVKVYEIQQQIEIKATKKVKVQTDSNIFIL